MHAIVEETQRTLRTTAMVEEIKLNWCLEYEYSHTWQGAFGGGGSSRGTLWSLGLTERKPLTGSVALPGTNAAGCSLRGMRVDLFFDDGWLKLGSGPSRKSVLLDVW